MLEKLADNVSEKSPILKKNLFCFQEKEMPWNLMFFFVNKIILSRIFYQLHLLIKNLINKIIFQNYTLCAEKI